MLIHISRTTIIYLFCFIYSPPFGLHIFCRNMHILVEVSISVSVCLFASKVNFLDFCYKLWQTGSPLEGRIC